MKRLLLALLFPLAISAQTVQNPSFEQAVTFTGSSSGGQWSMTAPGWTGCGVFLPSMSIFPTVPDGVQVGFLGNGGTCSQDLGVQPAATYTITIQIGNRADGFSANGNTTVSLDSGSTNICKQSVANSSAPSGGWATLSCSGPLAAQGDVVLSFGCTANQCDIDNIRASPKFTFAGSGGGTGFTVTMLSGAFTAPTCGPNDGKCSLSLQYFGTLSCDTASPPTCQIVAPGTLAWVKTFNGGQQIIFIANVNSP